MATNYYDKYLEANIGPATTAGGLPVVQKPILQPSVPSIFGTAPALQVNNGTPLPGLTYNTPGTVLTTTKPIAPKQVLPTVAPGSVASIGAYKGIPIKAGPDSYIQQQMSEIDAKSNTTPTTTTTAPAPGSVGSIAPTPIPYTYTKTPQEIADEALRQKIEVYNTEQFNTSTDPTQIYNDQLKQYQAQIDSINTLYNDQLNQARIQGQGRIESRQFAQGRSGQIGSGTGEAGINAVQDANRQVEQSIEAERQAAIQAVYGNVRKATQDELALRTAAKKQGADALLADLAERPARRKAVITNAVKAAIASGLDISTMSDEEIKKVFGDLGVSKGEILSEYKTQIDAINKEKEKAALELAKAQPPSVQEYEYAKKNGYKGTYSEYQNEDANRKAKAAGGGVVKEPEWKVKANQLMEFSSVLNQTLDQNNKLTPQQYQGYKSQYIAAGLGNAKDFDANYAQHVYINPKDKTYKYTESSYGLPKSN